MRLTEEQQARFIDILETAINHEGLGSLRSYSGRGMYGRQCVAISGDSIDPFHLALMIAAHRYDFSIYDIPLPDTDSLGRGVVVYWPQIDWPEGRVERDEEENKWA